jgi:hypothetical protein
MKRLEPGSSIIFNNKKKSRYEWACCGQGMEIKKGEALRCDGSYRIRPNLPLLLPPSCFGFNDKGRGLASCVLITNSPLIAQQCHL